MPFCVFEEKTLATLAPTTTTRKPTTTTTAEATDSPTTKSLQVAQNVKVGNSASDFTLYGAIAVVVGFVTYFAATPHH